jgi:hypothetical protein
MGRYPCVCFGQQWIHFGKAVDCFHMRIADFAKGGGRGDQVFPLPAKKRAYFPHSLQSGYVRLEKNTVDRTTPERHVIPE